MVKPPFHAHDGVADYVFVTYAHADADVVYPELERIHEQDINFWYDEGITGGSVWRDKLAQKISASNGLCFFASSLSIASKHCVQEISFALDEGIPVLVVFLDDTPLPAGLRLSLGGRQVLYHGSDDSIYQQRLLESLQQLIAGTSWDEEITSTPTREVSPNSVAVLPLANLMSDMDYLTDGITESLINGLGKVRGLRVASQTACFRFKGNTGNPVDIAKELAVKYIVEGNVLASKDRVRVSIHLIDTDNGFQTWNKNYDKRFDDIFDLLDDIGDNIVGSLNEVLRNLSRSSQMVGTRNSEAFQCYMQGSALHRTFEEADLRQALKLFERSADLDDNYFDAHLAVARVLRHLMGASIERQEKARSAVNKAQALAGTAMERRACMEVGSMIEHILAPNFAHLEEVRRNLLIERLNLSNVNRLDYTYYAWVFVCSGLHRTARAYYEYAFRELDESDSELRTPGAENQGIWFWLGCSQAGCGDLEQAIKSYDKSIEKNQWLFPSRWLKILAQNALGRVDESRYLLQELSEPITTNRNIASAIEANCLFWEGRGDELDELQSVHKLDELFHGFVRICRGDEEPGYAGIKAALKKRPNNFVFFPTLPFMFPQITDQVLTSDTYREVRASYGISEADAKTMVAHANSISNLSNIPTDS